MTFTRKKLRTKMSLISFNYATTSTKLSSHIMILRTLFWDKNVFIGMCRYDIRLYVLCSQILIESVGKKSISQAQLPDDDIAHPSDSPI